MDKKKTKDKGMTYKKGGFVPCSKCAAPAKCKKAGKCLKIYKK